MGRGLAFTFPPSSLAGSAHSARTHFTPWARGAAGDKRLWVQQTPVEGSKEGIACGPPRPAWMEEALLGTLSPLMGGRGHG